MSKVIFAKFSKERKEEYQIMTQVLEQEPGDRSVLKKAVTPQAAGHIRRMADSCQTLSEAYASNEEVAICPCRLINSDTVEFTYVEGESMEERLERHIREQEWEKLLEDIRLLEKIITGVKGAGDFKPTPDFAAIFGDIELPEGMRSGTFSNVDIIPTNLIFKDKCYMIDYEWCFPFPIPFSFTLYRALFHSVEISKLPAEMIDKIYETAHISREEREIYLQMEIALQHYITGEYTVLGELYQRMDRQCYMLRELDTQNIFTRVRLLGEKSSGSGFVELCNYRTKEDEISLKIDLMGKDISRLVLYPEEKCCVMELTQAEGCKGEERVALTVEEHNGALVRENRIYFLDPPCLKIGSADYDKVELKYRINCKRDNEAKRMAELVLNIRCLEEKIRQMENTKVWKAYRKYKDMRES